MSVALQVESWLYLVLFFRSTLYLVLIILFTETTGPITETL